MIYLACMDEKIDLTKHFHKEVSLFIIDGGIIRFRFTQIINAENEVTGEKKKIGQTVYGVLMVSAISCIQVETLEEDDRKDTYLIFGSSEGYLRIPCKDNDSGMLVLEKISEISHKVSLLPLFN